MIVHWLFGVVVTERKRADMKKVRQAGQQKEKKVREEQRKKEDAKRKANKRDREEKTQNLKESKKNYDANERTRKARLKELKYPVDDLQALSEVSLCDSHAGMKFYRVAEKHRELLVNLEQEKMALDSVDKNKSKYEEGMRVKMLLKDDTDEDTFFFGNVIWMHDHGMDIYFDDGDFQEGVKYDDEDVYAANLEQEELSGNSPLADFPPAISERELPAQLNADLMAISSLLIRFQEDVELPPFTLAQLISIVRDDSSPPAGAEAGAGSADDEEAISPRAAALAGGAVRKQRDELHVKLLHIIGCVYRQSDMRALILYVNLSRACFQAASPDAWPVALSRFADFAATERLQQR